MGFCFLFGPFFWAWDGWEKVLDGITQVRSHDQLNWKSKEVETRNEGIDTNVHRSASGRRVDLILIPTFHNHQTAGCGRVVNHAQT